MAMDIFTLYSDVLKYNPNHDERGRFTSGSGGESGKRSSRPKKVGWTRRHAFRAALQLQAVAHNRAAFDPLLQQYKSAHRVSELKDIAHQFTGYPVRSRTKAEIIRAMHNWQRESELNDDLHRSQARAPL